MASRAAKSPTHLFVSPSGRSLPRWEEAFPRLRCIAAGAPLGVVDVAGLVWLRLDPSLAALAQVERLLTERGVAPPAPGSAPSSVILIDGDRVLQRSDAALRAASYLRWPYRALTVLRLVPRPLRDLVYNFIARNRYRWFGKHESCRLPTPALRARFLDQEQPGGGGGPAVNAQK